MIPQIHGTPPLRDAQVRVLEQLEQAWAQGCDSVVIQAPTGTGKTLISRYAAEHFDDALVGVPTKALQDQYAAELTKTGGVAVLKGKANYQCAIASVFTTVDNAVCQSDSDRASHQLKDCMSRGICPFLNAKKKAKESRIAVLSLAGMLSYSEYNPDCFGKRGVHIIDEAHKLEDTVRDHFSLAVSESAIRKSFGKLGKSLPPMPASGKTEEIQNYLRECSSIAQSRISELIGLYHCETLSELFEMAMENSAIDRQLKPVLSFKTNVDKMFEATADDSTAYVTYIEVKETKAKIKEPHIVTKPVHLQSHIQDHVMGEKTIFLSATLVGVEAWAKSMGIHNYRFIDVESAFPAKNRRVFFTPIGNLNASNIRQLLPAGANFVRKLMNSAHFKNEKGLIHTPSYDLTDSLEEELLDEFERLLFARRGSASEALKEHVEREEPTVLVGPAFKEGIDLKDNLCRFQVIWKCAYGNPNDPLLIQKRKVDPKWEDRRMISDFIQQIGRGVRSKEDWAVTYVLDGNLIKLLTGNKALVPKYIWEAFQNI